MDITMSKESAKHLRQIVTLIDEKLIERKQLIAEGKYGAARSVEAAAVALLYGMCGYIDGVLRANDA